MYGVHRWLDQVKEIDNLRANATPILFILALVLGFYYSSTLHNFSSKPIPGKNQLRLSSKNILLHSFTHWEQPSLTLPLTIYCCIRRCRMRFTTKKVISKCMDRHSLICEIGKFMESRFFIFLAWPCDHWVIDGNSLSPLHRHCN